MKDTVNYFFNIFQSQKIISKLITPPEVFFASPSFVAVKVVENSVLWISSIPVLQQSNDRNVSKLKIGKRKHINFIICADKVDFCNMCRSKLHKDLL